MLPSGTASRLLASSSQHFVDWLPCRASLKAYHIDPCKQTRQSSIHVEGVCNILAVIFLPGINLHGVISAIKLVDR